jgi:archaellum component FlaF (FlaF/FlaG flagellin family)
MKNKRGVSPAISWILLIGLAVAMGAVVTVWMKSLAEDTADKLESNVETDIRCDDTSINAYESPGSTNCLDITLTNKGLFSIYELKVRYNGKTIDHDTGQIRPQTSTTIVLNIPEPLNEPKIGLIPVTKIDDKSIACLEKEITIICNP